MSEKVTVGKGVADAIEELRGLGRPNSEIIVKMVDGTPLETDGDWALFYYVTEEGEDALISALINGYKVDKSPEESLREYYADKRKSSDGSMFYYQAETVLETLNILGIKIEGVNTDD